MRALYGGNFEIFLSFYIFCMSLSCPLGECVSIPSMPCWTAQGSGRLGNHWLQVAEGEARCITTKDDLARGNFGHCFTGQNFPWSI